MFVLFFVVVLFVVVFAGNVLLTLVIVSWDFVYNAHIPTQTNTHEYKVNVNILNPLTAYLAEMEKKETKTTTDKQQKKKEKMTAENSACHLTTSVVTTGFCFCF